MATGDEDAPGVGKYLTTPMKVVAVVIFLPLLPLAVAFNFQGVADRLSPLPGITKGGGAITGIIALIYAIGILSMVAGGIAVTGDQAPLIGDDEPEPTATATLTKSPITTSTDTASPTPTFTATPSAGERRQIQLEAFEEEYANRVGQTMENESLTGVPVIGSDYRETDDGALELWVVFWECDFAMSSDDQWITLGNEVVNTAGPHRGTQPDRVRIYSVTNLTNFDDEITYIEPSDAEAVYNGSLDGGTYTRNWWERRHEPTRAENETAYQIVVEDSGQETADTAFYVDHADDDMFKCNGGAKPHEDSEHREEHQQNTNAIGYTPAIQSGFIAGQIGDSPDPE